ncbi:response regulator [Bacillus cereus ATCC 10876]|nr:response regulator [Bacillus cereus ATCC 10876]
MIKILVVDDHAFLRDAIRSILEDESDMKVVGEASSGDGVLGKVEECGPDCILMDINLPGKNGIEATELVKKNIRIAEYLCLQCMSMMSI